MKPFATLGSEISKVRERVRRSAESLRPAKVASDVRDQRDRLLAKLGEQTFRLIAERKLVVPKMLQESVERLASLLGVQLPSLDPNAHAHAAPSQQPAIAREVVETGGYDAEIDEPSVGDTVPPPPPAPKPAQQKAQPPQKQQKKGAKKHRKR
jgi:hypothetical protein